MRRRFFQSFNSNTVIALSALLVSLCALVVSIVEVNIMRSQEKAVLWPHLSIGMSYNSEGFRFGAINHGTGPALIKSVVIKKDNTYFNSWDSIIANIMPGNHDISYNIYRTSEFNKTVIPAGERRVFFGVSWNAETRQLSKGLQQLSFEVIYCSILDDCWIIKDGNSPEEISFQSPAAHQFEK